MALKTVFYINGQRIKEPLNYQELSIELNFDKDNPSYRGQVSTNSWEFGLGEKNSTIDAAKIINKHLNNGLIGGDGIFSPPELEIKLEYNSIQQDLFKGYLDMPNATYLCDRINADAIETGNIDWINEKAIYTYEYLYDIGFLKDSDFVLIPYQINSQAQKLAIAILYLTGFSIVQEIISLTRQIITFIKSISGLNAIGVVVGTILLLIELIGLIIQINLFIKNLIEYVIQKTRYKAGMYLHDLCRIGCSFLGLEFSSTILDGSFGGDGSVDFSNVVLIPNDFNQYEEKKKGVLGVFDVRQADELRGFYRGTLGDLLTELKTMFNAKIIINDGILRLERIDYTQNNIAPYIIPNVDRSESPVRYNTEDLSAYYNISFTPDLNDLNVFQDYIGTELQVITNPLNVSTREIIVLGRRIQIPIPSNNNLIKGEKINTIGFTLAAIKTDLTAGEKFLLGIVGVWYITVNIVVKVLKAIIIGLNKIIDVINDVIRQLKRLQIIRKARFIAPIGTAALDRNPFQEFIDRFTERRTRMMIMENHFINTPRLLVLENNYKNADINRIGSPNLKGAKCSLNNKNLLNASHLWNKFHLINSFIEDDTFGSFAGFQLSYQLEKVNNQKKIYEISSVPFCIEDYNKVKNNSEIIDSDGVSKGEIVSLKWNVYNQTADITFKVKSKYTNNLKITKILSDGR